MKCSLCGTEPELEFGYTKNGIFICGPCVKGIKINPLEEARAFRKYVRSHGWGSVSEVAKIARCSPSHVSQLLSLLEQPELVKMVEGRPAASDRTTPQTE